MTEVVGIDNFAPEPGASVSRYLDMKLEPYLDQFNVISESATKVGFQSFIHRFLLLIIRLPNFGAHH